MTTFGERLRQWRKDKGITSYAIIKETGIDRSNYKQIEKGERPASDDVLKRLASMESLGLSYETLKVWQRFENASLEEKIEALSQLANESELLPLVRKVIEEKQRGNSSKDHT